jgi:hypothetical protein
VQLGDVDLEEFGDLFVGGIATELAFQLGIRLLKLASLLTDGARRPVEDAQLVEDAPRMRVLA